MIVTTPTPDESGRLGAKARNLFRLRAQGLAVPPFFCVAKEAFANFLAPRRKALTDILASLALTSDSELPRLSHEIAATLATLSMPVTLRQAIAREVDALSGRAFAVRSSGVQEDSQAHSFAGLFRTFLCVPAAEVAEHVVRTWLGAFDPGLLGYCRKIGMSPLALELGVIVQQMVTSRAAGVMMTAEPTSGSGEIVIVASLGLGEGCVSDLVETDTYRYDRNSKLVRSTIGRKSTRMAFDAAQGSGTRREAVPPELGDAPILDAAAIHELVAVGVRAEAHLGGPQDIEWAFDEHGRLAVLQSRPITTIRDTEVTIFDNSNIVEGYPGLTLPLSFSALKGGYERNFTRLARALGFSDHVLAKNRALFHHMIGYVGGRVYYNLTNWYRIVGLNRVLGRRFTPAFDDMIGVSQKARASDTKRESRHDGGRGYGQLAWLSVNVLLRYLTIELSMRRYARRCGRLLASWTAGCEARPLRARSASELLGDLDALGARVFAILYVPLCNDMLLMLQAAMTRRLLERLEVRDSGDLFNGLMCGETDMESVLPVRAMVRLAALLGQHGIETAADPAAVWRRIEEEPALAEVRAAFAEYLARFGDRCLEELKLETQTFRDEPEKLVATTLRHVGAGLNVETMEAKEAGLRHTSETTLAARLSGRPLARLWAMLFVRKTRALLRNREKARLDRARIVGVYRAAYRAVGERLAAQGVLASPRDIYYLSEEEVAEIVNGSGVFLTAAHVQETVTARKAWVAECRELEPAGRLVFRGMVLADVAASGLAPATRGGERLREERPRDGILRGTPSAPGVVEAPALVVDDPSSVPDTRGKILVARMTDPGWVFLMISAAGLIVEKGSLLSHTAIIGRELGIPTIVGVEGAATYIRTGQIVRMDASVGEITLR